MITTEMIMIANFNCECDSSDGKKLISFIVISHFVSSSL